MEENNTTPPPASSPAPVAAVVTPEHISSLHRRLDQIGHAIEVGFKAVFAFVRKEAPAVGAGAAAVAAAVPGVGPIAAIVETVAGEAAAIANCANQHGNPCNVRTCDNFGKLTPPPKP